MGELVSETSQARVATRILVAARTLADSFISNLQTFPEHLFLLKPSDKACPSWYVVIEDDRRYRALLTMGYRRAQVSGGDF